MTLYPHFGTVPRQGYVNGVLLPVAVITDYVKIYSQIRIIKRDTIIIARREKVGKRNLLKLTGKGYHRRYQK